MKIPRWSLLAALILSAGGCEKASDSEAPPSLRSGTSPGQRLSYEQRRSSFVTRLRVKGAAPQDYDVEPPPRGMKEVHYPSGDLRLKAWVYVPKDADKTTPGLVYFHGGFALSSDDLEGCGPFLEEGFVVMMPSLRGENGNPGNYELFLGEVDDAEAAVRWLAQQDYADKEHIFTSGHSIGGGISALLALRSAAQIVHGGSSGGIYPSSFFREVPDMVPFDMRNPEEQRLRLLVGNTRDMKHGHFGIVGRSDSYGMEGFNEARREIGQKPSELKLINVPGDHFESLGPAADRYLEIVQSTLSQSTH